MTTLTIYRAPSTEIVTIDIDEKVLFTKKLMGEHKITCEFTYGSAIDLQIGDFVTYNSENYYINRLPDAEKINNSAFKYTIIFESVLYNLSRKLFISADGLADFSYNGTATDFITNIVASINAIDPGWTVGTVDTSDPQTLQFANESCRAVLTRVAEAFKMEFELSGKEISLMKSVGTVVPLTFQYGRDAGLYSLKRQQVSNQNIVTKVYGFGGTKNIPLTYRSRAKRLVFESAGNRFLTKNTSLYGVIEGQFTDENIYPQRTGTITSKNMVFDAGSGTDFNSKTSYVADSALDFNINDYLIEGITAMIVFKTGAMMGIECEIWKYDNATKRIYFNPYSDADGYTTPSYNGGSPVQPEVGDTYTLVNISLPQSYINTAEAALLAATQAYIDENSIPQVVYSCAIDPKYAASISLDLNVGDKVTIIDADLGINSVIRASGIDFPLVNPYQVNALIADFVPYTLQERIIKNTVSTKKETIFVDRRSAEQARRNSMRQKQMKDLLFDTDGYFDQTNIKPFSIETAYLAVGTKSRDFWLSGVVIKANYGGDANAFNISAGSLVHLQIQIGGAGFTWVIANPVTISALTPATAYYLYAKCSKAVLTGQWILSSSQITFEAVEGYYHFLVGSLFAVTDGYRDFDFVAGMTYISGNTVTTGIIRSIDGNTYFNLNTGEIAGKITFTGGSSGYANLTDRPGVGKNLTKDFWEWADLAGHSVVTIADGKVGDKALRMATSAYPSDNLFIPVDTAKVYRTSFWARAAAGTNGVLYFDLQQFQDNAGTPCAGNGGRSPYKPSGIPAHTNWIYYSFIWGAADFQANVRYVRPDILGNYEGTTGYWEVQGLVFEENTEVIAAATAASNAQNYIDNVLPGQITDLQNQIDGQVLSWFKEFDPLTSNLPASEWTTDALKQQHANDTFTNTLTGGCWRWQQSGGVWGWGVISDTATQQALTAAGIAQDTADGKRRVFVAQPTTPYDAGDLWSQGSAGDLMKCITARSSGAYVAADWDKAAKYTDDTTVNNLQIGGRNYARNSADIPVIGKGYNFYNQLIPSECEGKEMCIYCDYETLMTPSALLMSIYSSDYTIVVHEQQFYHTVLTRVGFNFTLPTGTGKTFYLRLYNFPENNSGWMAIKCLKLELGNKATDWTPAPEDVDAAIAAAQAKAAESDYLKTALQNNTTAEGGLLSTTLLRLGAVNTAGLWVEKAGVNGAVGTDSTPRIYSGGTLADAISRVAGNLTGAKFVVTEGGKVFAIDVELAGSFETAHDGARIKIDHASGAVIIYDANNVAKTIITSGAIPSLATLLATNSASVDATKAATAVASYSTPTVEDTQYSATLTLPSGATNYTITTPPIIAAVSVSALNTPGAEAMVEAYLVKPDLTEVFLGGVSASCDGDVTNSDSQNETIPAQTFAAMPSGAYKIKLYASGIANSVGGHANASISIAAPNVTFAGESVVAVSRIFRDGLFLITDASHYHYISPASEIVKNDEIRGFGVIAAAEVGSNGAMTNRFNAIISTVDAPGSGLYTVNHSIGNTNYCPFAIVSGDGDYTASIFNIGNNSFQVRTRNAGTGANLAFKVLITGQ